MRYVTLLLSLFLITVFSTKVDAQTYNTIQSSGSSVTACDSIYIVSNLTITNTNRVIDSTNYVITSNNITVNYYFSSQGIGSPTIIPFQDTLVLPPVSAGSYALQGSSFLNGSFNSSANNSFQVQGVNAGFTKNADTTCQGDSIQFTNTSCLSAPITWQVNGTVVSNQPNPTLTFTNTGNNTVKQITGQGSAADTAQANVYVYSSTNAGIQGPDSRELCSNISDTLQATQGFASYQWYKDGNVLNNETSYSLVVSSAGQYSLSVTDSNGCSTSDTVQLNSIVQLADDTAFCAGNSLTLDAGNPNASYIWQDGSNNQTFQADTSGTYYVEVTRSSGCKGYDTTNITVQDLPNVSLRTDTAFCHGGSVTLNAGNDGVNYTWQDGSGTNTYTADTSGNYYVTVTNANGCQNSDSTSITVYPAPTVDLGNDTSFCTGDSLTLDAGNTGISYLWQNGDTMQTLTVKQGGQYHVQVTNSFGCANSDTINVSVDPLPNKPLNDDTIICQSDQITLNAQNTGANYMWKDGSNSQFFTVSDSGLYWVQINSQQGCQVDDSIQVDTQANPNVDLGTDTSLCNGQSITLNAGDWTNYTWQNGSAEDSFQVNQAGQYHVQVKDTLGCSGSDTVNVQFTNNPSVNLGQDTAFCHGASLILDAGSWSDYTWQDGSSNQLFTVSDSGKYYVQVENTEGCKGSDTIMVNTKASPSVDLGNDTTICSGEVLTLDAGSWDGYLWQDGSQSQTFTVTDAGSYHVEVTNQVGCANADTIQVGINPSPQVSLGLDTTICPGSSLTLDAGQGTTYQWSDGSTGRTKFVTSAGLYWVEVTNANTCSGSDTIEIMKHPKPTVDLGSDTTICRDQTLQLDAGAGFNSYVWQDGSTKQTNTVDTSQAGDFEYWVTVKDQNSCNANDTVMVSVEICDGIAEKDDHKVNIYPNPVQETLKLDFKSLPLGDVAVSLTTGDGQIIRKALVSDGQHSFDVSNLSEGIYLLQIQSNDQQTVRKLLIR